MTPIESVDRLFDLLKRKFDLSPPQMMLADSVCSDDVNTIEYPSKFPYAEALTYFARAIGAAHIGDTATVRFSIEALQKIQGQLMQTKEGYWAQTAGGGAEGVCGHADERAQPFPSGVRRRARGVAHGRSCSGPTLL